MDCIKTKFGNATICNTFGYYKISSKKEGNHGKMLHRLILEDFYNIILPQDWVVHHEDGNRLNNEIWNLIPIPKGEHSRLHHEGTKHSKEAKKRMSISRKGRAVSEETRKKISKANNGRIVSDATRLKMSMNHTDYSGENNPMFGVKHSLGKKLEMSKDRNSSGYFRVNKHKSSEVKQGFLWRYQYYDDNGKRKSIESVDIKKLEEKVKAKGLIWEKL